MRGQDADENGETEQRSKQGKSVRSLLQVRDERIAGTLLQQIGVCGTDEGLRGE